MSSFPPTIRLAQDLRALQAQFPEWLPGAAAAVELLVQFPDSWPAAPPSVLVVSPRCHRLTYRHPLSAVNLILHFMISTDSCTLSQIVSEIVPRIVVDRALTLVV